MIIRNPWVGYLDRNFQTIKAKILLRMGELVPEITDHSDSNPLIIIIEAFSGIAEQLNYYIDNMARESFITTARRYSSVVKLSRLIDYRIKAKVPSSVDITISFFDDSDNPRPIDSLINLPQGSIFKGEGDLQFISTKDVSTVLGKTSVVIPCKQKTLVSGDTLGITDNNPNQVFSLGKKYVHNSVSLTIGSEPWFLVETLGLSSPTDKHYIVEVSANKEAYIRFGDNINGSIPLAGQTVLADYYESEGILGNIEATRITSSITPLPYPLNWNAKINNVNKAVGGTDFENIERIRRSAPLSIRTLDRAVTEQDYEDIALLCPGVDKAKVFFNCGKYVYLYVSPNGGGLASSGFLADVVNWFEDKKMITTFVRALPSGEAELYIHLEITGRFRVDGNQLSQAITNLLLDAYSYENSDMNKPIRTSDLISLVDNYKDVDFLILKEIYLKPFFRPIGGNVTPLNLSSVVLNSGSISVVKWKIRFDGTYFVVFKQNISQGNILPGETYSDSIITIEFGIDSQNIGSEWEFTTLPKNQDLVIQDFSTPVLKSSGLVLTINEQLT